MFRREEKALFEEIKKLSDRLAEDRIYEQVMLEVDSENYDPVAKAKAFEEALGDTQKARALYVKHRVRRIRDLAAEYQLWAAQQEAERRVRQEEAKARKAAEFAERNKNEERKANIRNELRKGKMPPDDIISKYRLEFKEFYTVWRDEEYARRYMHESSAWLAFLSNKGEL